jgi:hypothetical protein
MKAVIPPKVVVVEMSEFEATMLISLCNKVSGPRSEISPAYVTGQLRDALVEAIGGYDDESELPEIVMKQLGPANIFLASSKSQLPEDSMVYRE